MDNFYLTGVVQEVEPQVLGRRVARVSLSGSTLLVDLRLAGDRQLLASLDRTSPAIYLSASATDQSRARPRTSTLFSSLLRKFITGSKLVKFWKQPLDRIVQINFEKRDAADSKILTSLLFAFTGRSANAYLVDADGSVLARLFEQDAPDQPALLNQSIEPFDPTGLTMDLNDSITHLEILDRFFGANSIFGPQLKNEFLARSSNASPSAALSSLVEDLLEGDPVPLLYSQLPLDQVGSRVINLKTDLLLTQIELAVARDMLRYEFSSLSEAADQYYSARGRAIALNAKYASLKQVLTREINRRESAIRAIEADRARFEDPDKLKRYGDLILANLANARIDGASLTVVDYYDPDQTEIQIDIPKGARLEEAATGYFRRYQKARRAQTSIISRELEVSRSLVPLKQLLLRLKQEPTSDRIREAGDAATRLHGSNAGPWRGTARRERDRGFAVGRRFKSSDGYEIVVGRNDRDNDTLTFRIARPNDTWLHAADYPGSHVIVRNPTRESVPHRTITEAAELAAFYSQANREGKAAVHYTQRKFVSKPPRSKPGLVRLSSFKTILVQPRCAIERLA